MPGPLKGFRILDFTILTAGAEATGYLCDLGAEVIKVEPPGGEIGRRLTPLPAGESTFFLPQNRGKRSIVIDLKKPAGREIALKLAASCDAVVHNFRAGAMERLGLGYEAFRAVNPSIIYAEGTSHGKEGPDAEVESVDLLGQARSGVMSITGEGYPTPVGYIATDFGSAMQLAIGVLSALVWKMRTGEGQRVETSMLGSMITAQAWEMTHYLVTGEEPSQGGRSHHLLSRGVWGVYDTADGHLALAGLELPKLADIAMALDAPELAQFADVEPAQRMQRMPQVREALRLVFTRHDTQSLYSCLRALGIRATPVQSYGEVVNDPQVLANEYIVDIDHPKFGPTRMTGNPLRFSETRSELSPTAPAVGEHSLEVLREAGYSDEEVSTFMRDGVVA
ncbi:MAG TPA: CoA transferase [Dehalococcoidia bacterium]|jgi:crotonobetainyl-CoA:carnitine CoA-transferase CaiB-like acyl-CoA transferase